MIVSFIPGSGLERLNGPGLSSRSLLLRFSGEDIYNYITPLKMVDKSKNFKNMRKVNFKVIDFLPLTIQSSPNFNANSKSERLT